MKLSFVFCLTLGACVQCSLPIALAKDGQISLQNNGTNLMLQVQGSGNDDWWLQSSPDFITWTNHLSFGTLLSGDTNAPWRSVGAPAERSRYFRAVKTGGLYDPTVFHTVSLTFTQANWSNLLALARTYSTNVYCSLLTVDNGATNEGIGARFRGNTSFTGMGAPGSAGPPKKSLSISIDFANTNADLMGFDSDNFNNAYGDETIMREPLYFNVMRQYTVCPRGAMAQLHVNGGNRGVYSHVQQENGDLIREYFPSNDGDRWRAPNMDANGALVYLGNTNQGTYSKYYELKSDYNTNAWPRLINAIYILSNTSSNLLRDKVDAVLAVDRWLWFCAIENIFADDDSYWNKGSDYMMYYEPESGRIHPVEHDGNEAFTAQDVSTSPLAGNNRPVLAKLLMIPEWCQRYYAHMRTVLEESYNPTNMTALINQYHALSINNIIADPYKGYTTMATYTNDLNALKSFVTNRYKFLITHALLTPLPPIIQAVYAPTSSPSAVETPWVTARVLPGGTNGINSVWLYHRGKSYGRFACTQMFDDGAHADGAPDDGVFGAATTNYPAGTKVRFYVEARSANAARASSFSPTRAEGATWSYRVAISSAPSTPVVINELMASNGSTIADPEGEYDDWIELHNITDQEVDLTGHYLSDEPGNMRKWQFPAGTTIPANGYLLVWADEDGTATPGLHASFKLSGSGEQVYFTDTDANLNAVLDYVSFGAQTTDVSWGRTANDMDVWGLMSPTPWAANQ
jgi:hypothetical protein